MLFRIIQVTIRIIKGDAENIIVSHEAEDAVEDAKHLNQEA
jgi:C4-dicarboxylate transporter DctQ subunit